MHKLIREADPDVVEEWKWAKSTSPGTPVWSHDGISCTGESYKDKVKLTFAKGASLKDPARLYYVAHFAGCLWRGFLGDRKMKAAKS
jgi:hypothetical protein